MFKKLKKNKIKFEVEMQYLDVNMCMRMLLLKLDYVYLKYL